MTLFLFLISMVALAAVDVSRAEHYPTDPIAFVDRFLPRNEQGQPWSLSPHQRRVLELGLVFDAAGRLLVRLFVWSEIKKSGKTLLLAAIGLWWAATRPRNDVTCYANDFDQSIGRVFATMVALCRANGWEKVGFVKLLAAEIRFKNGSVIRAVASDYKGEAGGRQTLALFDELWGYESERAQRLFEEATPIPTAPSAWILVGTTAGFVGESRLLETLYERGLAGERLDDDLELYRAGEYVMFWSHTRRQSWQLGEAGDRYYAEQGRLLRPNTFARLHENKWVTTESTFITPALWDGCVVSGLSPVLADPDLSIFVAADAALKHDTAAVVAVAWNGAKLRLVCHKVWKPTATDVLDLETTIEAEVKSLRERFSLRRVVCDPWQMARSAATLKAAGVPIEDFPQTVPNLTAMGENLYELLKGRNLELYADADLRQQALNTVALESARGWRIAKDRPGKKIDAIVALGMAALAATAAGPSRGLHFWTPGENAQAESVDEANARNDREQREVAEQSAREIEAAVRSGGWWRP